MAIFSRSAAHSVIPPTGEGVNSGLEDAFLLPEHLSSGSATAFQNFNDARVPDLEALGTYAMHLRDNVANTDPVRDRSLDRVPEAVEPTCPPRDVLGPEEADLPEAYR